MTDTTGGSNGSERAGETSYHLFLDDERNPADVTWVRLPGVEWTVVRSFRAFVECLETKGLPRYISFDHDLAAEHYIMAERYGFTFFDYDRVREKTGYDAAKVLSSYCLRRQRPLPEWQTHTMNPQGKRNIQEYLLNYGKLLSGALSESELDQRVRARKPEKPSVEGDPAGLP